MADELSLWQSAISAAAVLGGVWIGSHLTSRREAMREKERINKEASYLAILVVAHLDRLANGCLHVAYDDGTSEGRPAGEDGVYHQTTVKAPTFDPLTLDVDWKALPVNLMYEILNLPYRAEELERHLSGTSEFDDPPDYIEYFWARQHGYAMFGLAVSDMARRLRLEAGLPQVAPLEGTLFRDDMLREQRDKIVEERRAYAERCAARAANESF